MFCYPYFVRNIIYLNICSVEKLSKRLNDKTVSQTFKSIFARQAKGIKSMDKLSEEIVKEKETNIQIGNAGGVNNKTRKTAWAEVEENDSHVKIGNTSIHRQSTSTADRNINEQRKTAHFGNASFNKMAKSMQERKEKQQSSSAIVGNRCFSRVSEKVTEKTIDHDKRCVSVGNTSISVETKTTQKSVSVVDIRYPKHT
jgi:hypothetical protein